MGPCQSCDESRPTSSLVAKACVLTDKFKDQISLASIAGSMASLASRGMSRCHFGRRWRFSLMISTSASSGRSPDGIQRQAAPHLVTAFHVCKLGRGYPPNALCHSCVLIESSQCVPFHDNVFLAAMFRWPLVLSSQARHEHRRRISFEIVGHHARRLPNER